MVGIGFSIALIEAVDDGLGKMEKLLDPTHIANVVKAQYAADILYIAALALAKVSILLLLYRLSVARMHKKVAMTTVAVTGVWALAGIITIAAECGSHLPWTSQPPQCIDIRSFWIGFAVPDILTELVVTILPVLMMIPVQVATSKKAVIVIAFVFRVLVIVGTITRLCYMQPATTNAPNITWLAINYNIATATLLSASIMTACIPCLKPFLDGFDSGMLGVSFKDRIPGGVSSASRSRGGEFRMQDLAYGNGRNASNMASALRSQNQEKETYSSVSDEEDPRQKMGVSVQITATNANRDQSPRHTAKHSRSQFDGPNRSDSVTSNTGSDQMIIKKNIQYSVQYEDPITKPEMGVSRRDYETLRDREAASSTHGGHGTLEEGLRTGYAM